MSPLLPVQSANQTIISVVIHLVSRELDDIEADLAVCTHVDVVQRTLAQLRELHTGLVLLSGAELLAQRTAYIILKYKDG